MGIILDVLIGIAIVLGGVAGMVLACVIMELVMRAGSLGYRALRSLAGSPAALVRAIRARSASPWLACSLSLLVAFDEQSGRFHASVQLRGKGVLRRPSIRLELVDGDGITRLARTKRLPLEALGSELLLPAFDLPDCVSAEDALSWRWDIVIEDSGTRLAHWREHPRPAGALNAEAELTH